MHKAMIITLSATALLRAACAMRDTVIVVDAKVYADGSDAALPPAIGALRWSVVRYIHGNNNPAATDRNDRSAISRAPYVPALNEPARLHGGTR